MVRPTYEGLYWARESGAFFHCDGSRWCYVDLLNGHANHLKEAVATDRGREVHLFIPNGVGSNDYSIEKVGSSIRDIKQKGLEDFHL